MKFRLCQFCHIIYSAAYEAVCIHFCVCVYHMPSRIATLSGSKCRYLQSLLRCWETNALRLNELPSTALMYIAALTPTQFAIYRSYGTHRHSSKRTPPHEQIYKYIAKLAKPELIFTIDYICTRNKMQLLL